MAAASDAYLFEGKEPILLKKWKVKQGSQLWVRTIILTYVFPTDKDEEIHKLESSVEGTVLELLKNEGELIEPGSPLMTLESCKHEIIMKDLCATCGADLRHLSSQNFQEVVASRSFSMVHVVPELRCSKKQADQLDEADESRLLKSRKLVLLVDLDQTIIHTTNDNVPQDLKDVHHFQLYGPRTQWYHTRLRPHTREFLEKIAKFYELHIFTFGARAYAHKIVRSILDPNESLFSHRILSRDECFDATSKTGNLKVLFPRGDSMVCIIDDREDVWNFAPNVIHVKPYIYFSNTSDINCPKFFPSVFNPAVVAQIPPNPQSTTIAEPMASETNEISEKKPEDSKCQNEEKVDPLPETSKDVSNDSVATEKEECHNVEMTEQKVAEINDHLKISNDSDDDDDYLLYLEEILMRIHRAYYDIYDETLSQKKSSDETVKTPDLRNVIPYVRKKVLRGVNLVFSGVIPTNIDPEKSSLWSLAKSFGAEVFHDLVTSESPLKTTHVVASKAGTAKLAKAKRVEKIHIVTPSWLMCCATRWERVDERLFPLKKGENPSPQLQQDMSKEKLKAHMKKNKVKVKVAHKGKHKNLYKGSNKMLQPVLDFSAEELANMGREVDEACTSSDEDPNEEQNDNKYHPGKRKRASAGLESTDTNISNNEDAEMNATTNDSQTNSAISNNNLNGNQQYNSSDDSDKNSNSSRKMSSDEEELVAEMERELFGEL